MTQNGPHLGPPWNSGDDEPYTAPADPWGDQPTAQAPEAGWGGHPTSMPPAQDSSSSGYSAAALNAPPPAWGAPTAPPPPPKRRNAPILALVVVLGLLICGGLGTTAWLLNKRDTGNRAQGQTVTPTSAATDAAGPAPQSSQDARFVKKGECVRNENTPDKPELKIVACASGTLEVLKRVDGRTTGPADAEQKCAKVPNYTKWFFYDSELDSLDFVLCMHER
jgi:hypothetical protein